MRKKVLQSGFSFIELIVIFALLSLLGAFVVPNLFRAKQGAQRKEFMTSFESLLKDTVLRSILTNTAHQVFIDIAHGQVQMRQFDPLSPATRMYQKFKLVEDNQYVTQIPSKDQKNLNLKQFVFKNFFINGVEEMLVGSAMTDVSFYIMPDGTSQAIVANLVDQDEDGMQPDVQFSFVINPFYARMSVHETFQKP